MNISGIEHIGIAVRDLDESIRFYEGVLGLQCYAVEEVAGQQVRTAFFRVGETKIELLESTGPEGPIARFIKQRGEGIHHIAYAVDDADRSLAELEKKGLRLVGQSATKGAEGLLTGFIHPSSTGGVLTELCSKEGGTTV